MSPVAVTFEKYWELSQVFGSVGIMSLVLLLLDMFRDKRFGSMGYGFWGGVSGYAIGLFGLWLESLLVTNLYPFVQGSPGNFLGYLIGLALYPSMLFFLGMLVAEAVGDKLAAKG